MNRRLWTGATSLAVLAPALITACSASPKTGMAANTSASPASKAAFTLDTPVERIAADPRGKAVLDRDVPGLMASKSYPLFDDMSLSQIALLSHGRLTKTKLALVRSDLVQISSPAAE